MDIHSYIKLFANTNDISENYEEFPSETNTFFIDNGIISEVLIPIGAMEILLLHRKHT